MQQDFPTLPTHLQHRIISGCVAFFDKDFLESCLVNKATQNVSLLLLQVLSLFVYYGYCIPHNNEKLYASVCWFTTVCVITNCLNNSGLLKLYPDVRVANYGSAHKGRLPLLLAFPTRLKTGK